MVNRRTGRPTNPPFWPSVSTRTVTTSVITRPDMGQYAMADSNRSRPRRTVSIDPVTDAYLGSDDVNAGRLIDNLVHQHVADRHLISRARDAGIADADTTLPLRIERPGEDR